MQLQLCVISIIWSTFVFAGDKDLVLLLDPYWYPGGENPAPDSGLQHLTAACFCVALNQWVVILTANTKFYWYKIYKACYFAHHL